jgi:predicted transcriptional regulator
LEITAYTLPMQGQDIALLLKLVIQDDPGLQSKSLAESLGISPSEVSKALRRCVDAGLLYIVDGEKKVNRSALMEFLQHGLRYVYPPVKGSMARGVPTAAAAEPLKSHFLEDGEPPTVWPYAEGKVRGLSMEPLYKGAPKAALRDAQFYGVLALCDAIRSGRARERNLAIEFLAKEIHA